MRSHVGLVVVLLLAAGCAAAPDESSQEPAQPTQPTMDADTSDLPSGLGSLAWQADWSNESGPAVTPPEPGGPFVHDVTLVLEGAGDAERLVANVTTEAETILSSQAVPGDAWRIHILHHHHGFTQDEADARAESLHNAYAFSENGTRLDMYIDTADRSAASAGAQTEIYLTFEVPVDGAVALHLADHGEPVSGPILQGSLRDACFSMLSLAADGHPVIVDYAPVCAGAVRLTNAGSQTEARLDDSGDAAFRGRAVSAGGDVEVDLAGVEFEEDTAERKVFDTPGWANATAPLDVAADAGGGTLRLLGCGHWDCPGGA